MKLQERDLTKQMHGEDVKLLQDSLRQLGYDIAADEVNLSIFGEATHVAVVDFQDKHGLRASGQVDEATANQIGLALAALESQRGPLIVRGHIRQKDDSPCSALPVKAFDKNLRREALLGVTITRDDGSYEITYTANQLVAPKKKQANLVVRAFDQDGSQLAESAIIFNAGATEVVDLFVALPDGLHPSEYKRLVTELRVQGVQPADLTEEDVAFLAEETGIDRQHIELLRPSEALARLTNLPPEVTYAFARRDLPLSLDELLSAPPDTLRQAVEGAIEENVIPARIGEELDTIMQSLEELRSERERRQQKTVVQQVAGQLLDQDTQLPLVGFTVRIFDHDSDPEPRSLGYSITNGQGYFSLVYTVTQSASLQDERENGQRHRLSMHFLDREATEIYQVEVSSSEDQQHLVIQVPIPVIPQPPSPTLDELATALPEALPEALLPFLANRSITTLADIRMAGGIHHLEGLPVAADHPSIQALEAHANLSVLSPDVTCNAMLIERGYTSIHKIAEVPRSLFVNITRDQLGDFKAAQLHVQARAEAHFLDNLLTGIKVDAANGYTSTDQLLAIANSASQDACNCRDCESAVSPLAYLYDLLTYAVKHLKYFNNPITLQFLTDRLYQPFGDFVVSCSQSDKKVRQVRICIEVLRKYLTAKPPTPPQQADLDTAEKAYLIAAYTTILDKIGTSYEEIRLARTDNAEKRQALADRLGIELGTKRPDHLDALFLDLTSSNEQNLEILFGLVDTTRDPLSDGSKQGDSSPAQITHWILDGVKWSSNTDLDGTIYLNLKQPSGSTWRIELYRDSGRTSLVASGEGTSATGHISVSSENNSGLTGSFSIAYTADSSTIEISVVPHFLSWQLKNLRTLWEEQDRPTDAYTEDIAYTDGLLPIIDPDLIGPPDPQVADSGDFRLPLLGQAPYELWRQRRTWVDTSLAALKQDREAHDLMYILKQVLGDHAPDLATFLAALQQELTQGTDNETIRQAMQTITGTLHLTVESFTRLMALKAKADDPDSTKKPTPAEWDDVYAILTQAKKLNQFPTWRTEEQVQGITLGPKDFWIALQEPTLTKWLATTDSRLAWQQALRTRSQAPIIDPDLISSGDLKEAIQGDPAYDLWLARGMWVTAQLAQLQASREGGKTPGDGFDTIINAVLGVPTTDLVALAAVRDKSKSFDARLDQLTLNRDAFLYLLRMRNLLTSTAPVLDSEWSDVYSILAQVQKRREFAAWHKGERERHMLLGPDSFQIQLPSAFSSKGPIPLPRWRATSDARSNWQDTLQSRIDQEKTSITGLQGAISATEEITLPPLRDALILATDAEGIDPGAKATWITNQLLIDAKADGCQETTRLSQMIETVQGLLFAARTGQLKDSFMTRESEPAAAGLVTAPPVGFPPPPSKDKLDVFVLSTDNAIWHGWYYHPSRSFPYFWAWHDWESLGGEWTSAPAAVWSGNELDVFVRGADNAIYHKQWLNGKWQDNWVPLGGLGNGTSAPTAAWDGTGIALFVRGADNAVYQKQWADGSWTPIGFQGISAPAAAGNGNQLDVFVLGPDEDVLHKQWSNNKWQDNWESLGGVWTSRPAAVWYNIANQDWLDVFVRGTDNAIWHKRWSNGQWQDISWLTLGGEWTSGPAAGLEGNGPYGRNRADVFVQGPANSLWRKQGSSSSPFWESLPIPSPLTLEADNFDDEWKWIGAYSTWRAAMFVFLYPENILLPTLRRPERETPAFNSFVKNLRSNRQLTPAQARQAATSYFGYVRDINSYALKVEASCTAATPIGTTAQPERPLLYTFARGGATNTVYWSVYDPLQDQSGFGQTFWDTVPGLDKDTQILPGFDHALQILGAVPFLPHDYQRWILLFVKTQEKGVQKLVMAHYDLLTQTWSEELTELKLPQSGDFTATVQQRDFFNIDQGDFYVRYPPPIVILSQNGRMYLQRLNEAATDWVGVELTSPSSPGSLDLTVSTLVATPASGFKDNFEANNLIVQLSNSILIYFFRSDNTGGSWTQRAIENKLFLGAFVYPNSTDVYIFARDLQTGALSYGSTPIDAAPTVPITLDQGVKDYELLYGLQWIATYGGFDPAFDGRMLAFRTNSGVFRFIFTKNPVGNQLNQSAGATIAPVYIHQYGITEQISEQDLQKKADEIRSNYLSLPVDPTTPSSPLSNRGYLRTYLDEAHYFVPLYLALQLQQAGQYTAALDWFRTVYDYSAPGGRRTIWYGFELEKALSPGYQRVADWLLDPLNPHAIAETRQGTYLRYTLLALVRCFLEFADSEFTLDTAESIPRARGLYITALELLDLQELYQQPDQCSILTSMVGVRVPNQWEGELGSIKQQLATIPQVSVLKGVTGKIQAVLQNGDRWERRFEQARMLIRQAKAQVSGPPTIAEVFEQRSRILARTDMKLLAQAAVVGTATSLGIAVGTDFLHGVASVSGLSATTLVQERNDLPWLATHDTESMVVDADANSIMGSETPSRRSFPVTSHPPVLSPATNGAQMRQSDPWDTLNRQLQFQPRYVPALSQQMCIAPNPIVQAIRLRAELNLFKLRTCRNIDGQQREIDPYSASTDQQSGLPLIGAGGQLILPGTLTLRPTAYRYTVLIERAKQLVNHAQQLEAAFLSILEKRDQEAYNLLKARQDVRLARAGIQLQDLKITEAAGKVKLAGLQQDRAQIQVDHYQNLLEQGINGDEYDSLNWLKDAENKQNEASDKSLLAMALPASVTVGFPPSTSYSPSGIVQSLASSFSSQAAAASTQASILSTLASYERRAQDWQFQQVLGQQDVKIGAQQVTIAQDDVRVAGQERNNAVIQADNAEAVVDFLANKKFTNYGLYDWMSNVLEGVYRFFLQQATAVAQLADNQLAFERQEIPPPFIQHDYWEAPSDGGSVSSPNGSTPDRRGLTGSARLLQDIYQLDQYAFDTDKRKLQLIHNISLSQFAPAEFQRFRETGVMIFATPMELYDRRFPGHYLRLIHRVRTSVIALIPAVGGIRATLSSTGTSRVVIGGDAFQTMVVRRDPESVALSSPRDATGLFELNTPSDMLLPFEGMGVDTTWEFQMPKAANLFDYRSIADVILTIEYTALNSVDYAQQVIQMLNPTLSADRPFSFRNELADQWYDLHNPDPMSTTSITVSFNTQRDDFPPNIEDLRIQQVLLYFARADSQLFKVQVDHLHFTVQGETVSVGGQAQSVDGIISTRRGNASSWISMIGKVPFGTWELALPNTDDTKKLFADELIDDILFVITYSGRTPAWPV